MQKYSLDENYFDVIDTEHKAYWLGFLYADGSLSKTTSSSSGKNRLQLTLSVNDIEQLEKFKNDLNFTGPIHKSTLSNAYKMDTEVCYMHINSRPLCISLERHGFELKDNRVAIPNMSKDLIPHFIRGYFDGDGCISVFEYDAKRSNGKTYHRYCQEFSITSNEDILQEFKSIFEKECNVSKRVKFKVYNRTSKAVSLRYGGKQDVISLYHYMYDNATIYMARKYNNFQQVLLR